MDLTKEEIKLLIKIIKVVYENRIEELKLLDNILNKLGKEV